MKNTYLFFLMTLLFFSCNKEPDFSNNFSSFFGINDYEKALSEVGKYAIFATVPNGGLLIENKAAKLAVDQFYNTSSIFATFMPDVNLTSNRTDAGIYKVNGKNWEFKNGQYLPTDISDNDIDNFASSLFGKETELSLEKNNNTIVTTKFYAPLKISELVFSNTTNVDESSAVMWLNKNSTEIKWNEDTKNENGVLLVLSSQKDKLGIISQGAKQTTYKVLLIKNDIGSFTIPSSFFNGFETNDRIRLTLYRGNFVFIEDDGAGKSYKFYALSENSRDFALK